MEKLRFRFGDHAIYIWRDKLIAIAVLIAVLIAAAVVTTVFGAWIKVLSALLGVVLVLGALLLFGAIMWALNTLFGEGK